MRAIERIELINSIARELQGRMTFSQITAFLKACNIKNLPSTLEYSSKKTFSEDILSNVSDESLIMIASELGMIASESSPASQTDPSFWAPSHFKLFLSHISAFKRTTKQLQVALKNYGISAFVAHVDIEPTKEWLIEIHSGLATMDALAAILMKGFNESKWTDQEVGFAVGRGVLIIPIIKDLNPYGFIEKYQGLHADGKSVADVAQSIFQILSNSTKTKNKMLSCLIDTCIQSQSSGDALFKLNQLATVKDIPKQYLENLRDAAGASKVLSEGAARNALNNLLTANNIPIVQATNEFDAMLDDIPF